MSQKHQIKIKHRENFSGQRVYMAVCTCGRYTSGEGMNPVKVTAAGEQHALAKNTEEPDQTPQLRTWAQVRKSDMAPP